VSPPAVVAIQRDLMKMGISSVRMTGRLDTPTVGGINGVLGGWDDAPPALRTGQLTAPEIARKLPLVVRYVHLAVHGALNIAAGG
jgi:hypothetical protein